jgi:hypothetical protein
VRLWLNNFPIGAMNLRAAGLLCLIFMAERPSRLLFRARHKGVRRVVRNNKAPPSLSANFDPLRRAEVLLETRLSETKLKRRDSDNSAR